MRTRRVLYAILGIALLLLLVWALVVPEPDVPATARSARPTEAGEAETRSPDVSLVGKPPARKAGTDSEAADPETTADITGGNRVQGLVVRRDTGHSVPGALVSIPRHGYGQGERLTRSDVTGAFILRNLSAGPHDVVFMAEGLRATSVALVALPDPKPVTIELDVGSEISGAVTDETGAPVGGARVWATATWNRIGWPAGTDCTLSDAPSVGNQTETDAAGRFRIRGLTSGVTYSVRAARTGCLSLMDIVPSVLAGPDSTEVSLQLQPVATVTYDVRDAADGSRIPAPYIDVISPPGFSTQVIRPFQDYERMQAWRGADAMHRQVQFLRYSLNGSWPPLEFTVRASVSAFGYEATSVRTGAHLGESAVASVRLRPIAQSEQGFVRIVSAAFDGGGKYEGSLRLVLVNPNERKRATVTLAIPMTEEDSALPLPAGTYTLHPQGAGPAGHWWRPAGDVVSVEIRTGETTEVSLRLKGNKVIVRPKMNGNSIRGFSLGVYPEARGGGSAPAMGGGRRACWDIDFLSAEARGDLAVPPFLWLPPGRMRLSARVPGWRGSAVVTPSGDGTVLEVDLTLQR